MKFLFYNPLGLLSISVLFSGIFIFTLCYFYLMRVVKYCWRKGLWEALKPETPENGIYQKYQNTFLRFVELLK